MSYVVTLAELLPPRRTDHPWTKVRIEEAAARGGPFVALETQTLPSPDVDPENPVRREVTTELAQQIAGWYRVVWIDATSDESPPSEPISMPGPWVPSSDDVAAILRARLRESGGAIPQSFTTSTSPTVGQVESLIAQHASMVMIDVGDLSDDSLICAQADDVRDAVRALIAQRVAGAIELSYWPEEVVTTQTAEDFWNRRGELDQARVVQAAKECRMGEIEPEDEPPVPMGSFKGPRVGDPERW